MFIHNSCDSAIQSCLDTKTFAMEVFLYENRTHQRKQPGGHVEDPVDAYTFAEYVKGLL